MRSRRTTLPPGADGTFDAALTNGLLAVVAVAIPGHRAANMSGSMPPASQLLRDLVSAFGSSGGLTRVPTGEEETHWDDFALYFDSGQRGLPPAPQVLDRPRRQRFVDVNTDLLIDALVRTQAARHDRGPTGLLTKADVEELLALDEHPALGALSDHQNDARYAKGRASDAEEAQRAYEVLSMLTDADRADRVAHVKAEHGDPAPGADAIALQERLVCGNETLVATGGDEFGYGTVSGTCQVCSYRQSDYATEELNLALEREARWADDCRLSPRPYCTVEVTYELLRGPRIGGCNF